MTENVTNELMFEVLKAIQSKLDRHDDVLKDIQEGQLRLREDVHRVEGSQLRAERQMAGIEVRLDRIEDRFNMVEA